MVREGEKYFSLPVKLNNFAESSSVGVFFFNEKIDFSFLAFLEVAAFILDNIVS